MKLLSPFSNIHRSDVADSNKKVGSLGNAIMKGFKPTTVQKAGGLAV
jgi:hypothetical protein